MENRIAVGVRVAVLMMVLFGGVAMATSGMLGALGPKRVLDK